MQYTFPVPVGDQQKLFPASKSYSKTIKPADNVYRGLTESFSSSPA